MINIITTELAQSLSQNHKLLNNIIINPQNFDEIYEVLKNTKSKKINIIDITNNNEIENNKKIIVKDHINQTGSNILIGNQKKLNLEFLDLTNIYTIKKGGIITTCCGTNQNSNIQYSSRFLCNVSIVAKAMNYHEINGYLYNIIY